MDTREIECKLEALIKAERRVTRQIVELIKLCLERDVPLARGFSEPVKWLVETYGYCEQGAYLRLNAARALSIAPELGAKIDAGQVSVSSLARVQTAIRNEEKCGAKITMERKREVLRMVEGSSLAQTKRVIARELPNGAAVPKESLREVGADEWTMTVRLTQPELDVLRRARELASHASDGWGSALAKFARAYLEKNDPIERDKRRVTRGFAPSRAANRDRAVAKHGRRCAYVDPATGRRCDSRVYLQVEHLVPRARGGADDQTNLSCLCGPHNRFAWRRLTSESRRAN